MSMPYGQGIQYLQSLQGTVGYFSINCAVSADQVGKFPDSNIGDALKRINGINVQYDQGEAASDKSAVLPPTSVP